ncbi:SemiSWEET transporter [Cyanobium sp. FACHB-13342]|uniref:SemiSWEET transporter n=1 Tax=Cyanobium sp. FACHB-13342 TaxID=2692793 RepID=UPI001681A4F2|nr:SemiSWEET transporter [Cyanobium sp. FACHB-13342]MBD2423816.1 SemiSWEET transporter [Cyanobium sp. FACHB-13342]
MSQPTSAIDILGYVAASLTTSSFIPQAMRTLSSSDTRGISLSMYTLFTSGIALWLIYGALTGNGPLIIANAITVVLSGLILQRKLENHQLDNPRSSKISAPRTGHKRKRIKLRT